nr:farnesyl diphosphate synthase [Shouchella shacheensis]
MVERKLPLHIASMATEDQLKKSMIYSLEAGGKRVRPVLVLAVLDAYNLPLDTGVDVACAIEMVHTYSLVHDDLPAMDNDDLRRGKPTNHKVFGEATAILAGDALLTRSFGVIADVADEDVSAETKLKLIQGLSKAAGAEGMVGGQMADMEAENRQVTAHELASIHHRKTGDLLSFAILAGALIGGVSEVDQERLRLFGQELGLLFQIKDDILDVEGDASVIGKPVGSDLTNNKSTYPSLLGLGGAKEMLETHYQEAKAYLRELGLEETLLASLLDYVTFRDR